MAFVTRIRDPNGTINKPTRKLPLTICTTEFKNPEGENFDAKFYKYGMN